MSPDLRKRQAALRRALIGAKPEYFSWPEQAQERYRVTMPAEDRFKIEKALLAALFHIRVNTEEEMEAALDAFDDAQYLLLNSATLPLRGIGDDCFYLNEWLGENKTLLDFETLYDYDYDDHCFQEQARQEEFPDYTVKPYRGSLYYCWARLEIDGAFHYAFLSMAAGHLYGMLDERGVDKILELIPHDYIDGPEHGKREGKGTIWDLRVDAGGLEAQLKELQDRYYRYIAARQEALSQVFDAKSQQQVYQIDKSRQDNPQMNFVFTDKTALQAVRFRHFMRDCRAIRGDSRELEALIEQERQNALVYLERNYQDILDNFDPKVVKFRKKHKIVLADGALDDLF